MEENRVQSGTATLRVYLPTSGLTARLPLLALTLGPAFALLIVTALVSWLKDVSIWEFTRDVVATQPFYTGVISQIGFILWAGAISAAALTAFVLWKRQVATAMCRYLLALAVLTSLILADDMFMIHEWVVPHYLGLSEATVYLALAVVAIGVFIRHFWTVLDTDVAVLALAGTLLALSMLVDLAGFGEGAAELFVEDGLKFLGIAAWLAYVVATCADTLIQGESA